MADLHKYTTKEVLNKILLDSSGNAVAAYSHTTQEALNAVLDSANSRLNVSLVGGTISGDVTISGDLTVEGSSSNGNFDEIVQGGLKVQSDANDFIIVAQDAGGGNIAGIYKSSLGDSIIYGYNASHTEKFRLNSNGATHFTGGNVGIGTSSPDYELDIQSNGDTEARIKAITSTGRARLRLDGNNDVAEIYFSVSGSRKSSLFQSSNGNNLSIFGFTNQNTIFSVDLANDRVGIGTDSPAKKLHIFNGSDGVISNFYGANADGVRLSTYVDDSSGYALIYAYDDNDGGSGDFTKLYLGSNNSGEEIVVDGGGRLGIGTSSPNSNSILHIVDGAGTMPTTHAGDSLIVQNNANTSDVSAIYAIAGTAGSSHFVFGDADSKNPGRISYDHSNDGMDLVTNSTVRININSSGNQYNKKNIYVGTIDGSTYEGSHTSLNIYHGVAGLTGSLNYNKSGIGLVAEVKAYEYELALKTYEVNRDLTFYTSATSNNPVERMRILHDGDIGINQNSPSHQLHITHSSSTNYGLYVEHSGSEYSGLAKFYTNSSNNTARSLVEIHNDHASSTAIIPLKITQDADGTALAITNGKVGIGTDSPVYGLDVRNTGYFATASSSNQLTLGDTTNGTISSFNTTNGALSIKPNGSTNTRMVIDDDSRISLSNNAGGNNNTVFGKLAGLDLTSDGHYNSFFGEQAGTNSTHTEYNTAIGYVALHGSDGTAQTGDSNTAIGALSLFGITTGFNNVAVGRDSLRTLADGTFNIAIGNSALYSETGGDTTVAIGQTALYSQNVTSGVDSENTGVGYLASYYNVTGRYNTAIGSQALKGASGQSHSYNTAVGHSSLLSITDGTANIGIGSFAGSLTTTGDNNIAIGSYDGTDLGALRTNVAGSFNIAIGTGALKLINDNANDGSVAIGHKAGFNKAGTGSQYDTPSVHIGFASGATQTTGANNTSVGHSSMGGNATGTALTGDDNTVMGYSAGYAMHTGSSRNTIMGSNAGVNLTTGSEHVIIGSGSGKGITDGGNNTYVGYAVATNTSSTGNSNTFVGSAIASAGAVTGNYNTAVGRNSLLDLTTGNNNVAIGFQAGQNVDSGIENTIVGVDAGDTITGGDYNTILGRLADGAATANGQIAVGYGALTSGAYGVRIGYSGTAHSNSTVIGGLSISSEQTQQTIIGHEGVFKFVSKKYEADHASNDDGDIASSHGDNLKLPANSVIKSVSAIITRLSDLGTYNLSVVMSDDSSSPLDDNAMTNPVELIGVGATTSKSGGSGNASDIECGSGAVLKKAFYNAFDGEGQHVGASAKYIHLVNAGTGNGDTDPSTTAQVSILVEYIGME